MLKKLNWFCLTGLITLVLLMWKWIVELSLLNWIGALTLSLLYRWLLKLPPRKLGSWFLDCISINLPNGLAWNTVVISGLLHLIATWNCKINFKMDIYDGWFFTCCLTCWLSWTLVSLLKWLFYRYYLGWYSSELAWLVPLLYSCGRSAWYTDRLHYFSVTFSRCYEDLYSLCQQFLSTHS